VFIIKFFLLLVYQMRVVLTFFSLFILYIYYNFGGREEDWAEGCNVRTFVGDCVWGAPISYHIFLIFG